MTENRRGAIRAAVEKTVSALVPEDLDAATIALALRYADEIDGAAAAEARARRLVEDVRREHGSDSALYERVTELQAQLSSRSAVLAVGKSLQVLLGQMTATRKDRKAAPRGITGGQRTGNPLGELRAVPNRPAAG